MRKSIVLLLLAVIIIEYGLMLSTQVEATEQEPSSDLSALRRRLRLPYILLYDAQGNLRNEFVQGERIRIVTYFPRPVYLVTVTDPTGRLRFGRVVVARRCHPYGVFDSGLLSGLTDMNGAWHVSAGIIWRFKVKTFFVIPVTPLGVVGVFAACITGMGFSYVRTRRKSP